MTGDLIKLTLPARPEYLLTIRMVVSSVASRLDFDIDTLEDMKAGAAEACILLLNAKNKPERFDITILIDQSFTIIIEGSGNAETDSQPGNPEDIELLAKCLIEEFYDEFAFDYKDDDLKSVTIKKHIAA